MKDKNKGRKIYKTKETNTYQKSVSSKIFSAGLTVLFLGGVVFIGYSSADQLMHLKKKKGDSEKFSSIVMEYSSDDSSELDVGVINNPEATAMEFRCVGLTADDLKSELALETAVNRITANTEAEYIMVPLKTSGGNVNYNTTNKRAQLSGAVTSQLGLNEICFAIRTAGYKPVANISLLSDNIYPQTYPESSYKTVDDGSRWIDNSVENGGKPWISPYTEECKKYISLLVNEISSADFEYIVCSDIVFPEFREGDLELLDDALSDPERYLVLTSLMNTVYSDAMKKSCPAMLEVSAVDIAEGRAEVLQPMLLSISTLIVDINTDELAAGVEVDGMPYDFIGAPDEKVKKILALICDKIDGFNVVIRVSGKGVEASDELKIKEAINGYGFKSYSVG